MSRRLRAVVLAALALLALATATAYGAAPRADFTDVEDEVMCDTCNVPLYIAESPRADQLRAEIRDLIARGMTKRQIKDQLKSEYGPNILAEPDKSGLGVLAYVLPVAVALLVRLAIAAALARVGATGTCRRLSSGSIARRASIVARLLLCHCSNSDRGTAGRR